MSGGELGGGNVRVIGEGDVPHAREAAAGRVWVPAAHPISTRCFFEQQT